jgi:hypothetical protein
MTKPSRAKLRKMIEAEFGESVLTDALFLVNGDRQRDYGTALENLGRIAKLWSVLFDREVTEEEVAMAMEFVKLARLMKSPDHRDTQVDIAGYAGVIEKIQQQRRALYEERGDS